MKFLKLRNRHDGNSSRLNYEEIEHLNKSITSKESVSILKENLMKSPGPGGFTSEFYSTLKKI